MQSTNISEQLESILLTILPQISIFFFEMMVINVWSRYFLELLSRPVCQIAISFHTHTSLHDQPCHKTMKKYEDLERMVVSLLPPRKFVIRTWFCNCQQYLCLFHIVFEYIPSNRSFIVLKHVQHCNGLRKSDIPWHFVKMKQFRTIVHGLSFGLILPPCA